MMEKLLLAVPMSMLLVACQTTYQPPIEYRKVAYPLLGCDSKKLEEARKHLVSGEDLQFDESWVCATRPPPVQAVKDAGANPGPPSAPDFGRQESTSENKEANFIAFASRGEAELRTAVESDFLQSDRKGRPLLGIALAGGGSKAAAFGVGVMAGLADGNFLDSADYISSVSGGSYAAYFYYTHRVFPLVRRKGPRQFDVTSQQLFSDCVQRVDRDRLTTQLWEKIGKGARGACDKDSLLVTTERDNPPRPGQQHLYQAFLRCQQDIFSPGKCSNQNRRGDYVKTIASPTLAATLALIPLNLLANVLFDWGWNLSDAAHTYRHGIGMAYGTTATHPSILATAGRDGRMPCYPRDLHREADAIVYAEGGVLDCWPGHFMEYPDQLTYQELRTGLLQARGTAAPIPFWIINATAPRYRSAFGWWSPSVEDVTNQDMFEMTAVSHGSGRFGYVPAPMSLHRMAVLDSVAASAAFADSSQMAVTNQVQKGALGIAIRLTNFDWGSDIQNYNVTDRRRAWHKALPAPLYWADSGIDRSIGPASRDPELVERQHTAFIRLIDGGNSENLGLFALVKRQVKTIVVADSAGDSGGLFKDMCAFGRRLKGAPGVFPKTLHIPGLKDFDSHCEKVLKGDAHGYSIHEWRFAMPVLVGCLRVELPRSKDEPCAGLGDWDTRLLIAKPALNVADVVKYQTAGADGDAVKRRKIIDCQLLDKEEDMDRQSAASGTPTVNCETTQFLLSYWDDKAGPCQTFPQDGTMTMTLDSSPSSFSAYRELGREYLLRARKVLTELTRNEQAGIALFDRIAREQGSPTQIMDDRALPDGQPRPVGCNRSAAGPWRSAANH